MRGSSLKVRKPSPGKLTNPERLSTRRTAASNPVERKTLSPKSQARCLPSARYPHDFRSVAGAKKLVNLLQQIVEPVAGNRRNRKMRLAASVPGQHVFPVAGRQQIDRVPGLHNSWGVGGINVQFAENFMDAENPGIEFRVHQVPDTHDDVGVGDFFQRCAKCSDQLRRKIGHEANRVGKHRFPA